MKRIISKHSKSLTLIISLILLTVSLVGCGGNGSSTPDSEVSTTDDGKDTIVLRFAGVNPTEHPIIRSINEVFKPMVEEKTEGRVEVQVFDNSVLGGERDLMEQLQVNSVQMAYISPVLATIDPAINVMDLPYLFKNYDHVDAVIDGELGRELLKDIPEQGLIHLGYFENGFRVVTNSKKPVNSLEDLKGLKIRTPEAPISVSIFESLGANVSPLSFSELYSALQQGVVDGQENAYNTVTSSRFYEVQDYVAETNHMWGNFAILASKDWWDTLDSDIQEIIEEASAEASVYQRELFREEVESNKQVCVDAGMEVTTPDLEEFRKATESVYEDFFEEYPEYESIANEIRELGNNY